MDKKQLKEIANGFTNLAKDVFGKLDDDVKYSAQKRYAICDKCKHKTKTNRCNLCGCFLPAKTKSMDSSCPIGLW